MLSIENLPWLERLSDDISLKPEIIKNAYLNERQLTRIAKQVTPEFISTHNIQTVQVGMVSNYNVDLLKYPLIASGLRYKKFLDITIGQFNNAAQEALNPDSEFNRKSLDVIFILLDHRVGDNAFEFIQGLIDGFNQNRSVTCIIQTIVPALYLSPMQDDFNKKLSNWISNTPHRVLDLARLAFTLGLQKWHHPTQYYWAKLGFSQSLVPLVADQMARAIAGVKGYQKKCIVIDLDNTIWGGVVGDVGAKDVIVGQGTAQGEAFVEFQKVLLFLKQKGFLLAICSKNDEENAKAPFIHRSDMVLKLNDFVAFKANWLPKSHNIKNIANELSLGLDSMIFIDDNIAEREEVRFALHEVAVPAMPADPAYYPFILLNSGLVDTHQQTKEDENRTERYQDNAKREAYRQQFADLRTFYASLNMKLNIFTVTDQNKTRIVQLINKTNQFNLTQKRMTEAEFDLWINADNHFAMCFDLIDKFGNNGIIGVLLIKKQANSYYIENFILSCRVIGREVEHAIINFLVALACLENIPYLIGEYIPGTRNEIVEKSYQKWGFEFKAKTDKSTLWELKVSDHIELSHCIDVLQPGSVEVMAKDAV